MTPTARAVIGVRKEIRALSLAWLASLVAIVAMAQTATGRSDEVRIMAMLAYFFGTAALGALSIGHEYSHRTLGVLLSQPARRERLLFVKFGVLAVMLLALGLIANLVLSGRHRIGLVFFDLNSGSVLDEWLPVLCGLFIAPWLTMLLRGPLAGAVFTTTVVPTVFFVGQLLGSVSRYGLTGRALDRLFVEPDLEVLGFATALLAPGTLAVCVVGAAMTWRTFVRLEAIEGRGPELGLPDWLLMRTTRHVASPLPRTLRHAVWLLVKKELMVQQTALLVAGLYFAGWLAVVSLTQLDQRDLDVFAVLTFVYAGWMSLLTGSLASAEERQLGTLEWQLLLPMAAAKQWAVKVALALGLALLLAIGWPALLWGVWIGPWQLVHLAVPIVVLTVVGLYVSSISSSGLQALLISLTVIFGAAVSIGTLIQSMGDRLLGILFQIRIVPALLGASDEWLINTLAFVLAGAFCAATLRLALANHRSSDRAAGRGWSQAIWMAASLIVAVTLMAGAASAIAR